MTTQLNLAVTARRLDAAGVEEFTSAELLNSAYPKATGSQQAGRIHAVNALVRKGVLIAFLTEDDEAWMRENEECPAKAIAAIRDATRDELADCGHKRLHYRLPTA